MDSTSASYACEDVQVSLRVMTWNLWWRFGDYDLRQRAIRHAITQVDPDIVCLQEVWCDETRDQATELAAALDMHVARTDPVFFHGESFGNAVMSRWPMTRIASESLPTADDESRFRRIVAASVDTPWGSWPIASTHFDHRFDQSADRQAQARRLLERGLEWRGDSTTGLPLIIGADLNAVPTTDEIRMLTGRRSGVPGIVYSDTWEHVGDGTGHTWRAANPHSKDSSWPDRRLDYLLVSWPRAKPVGNPLRAWLTAIEPVDVGGTTVWASDHAAVVAEFVTP